MKLIDSFISTYVDDSQNVGRSRLLHDKFLNACKAGTPNEVRHLLKTSGDVIDVNMTSNDHKTCLFHAINSKSSELVQLLIRQGADVTKKSFVSYRPHLFSQNFISIDEEPLVTAVRIACPLDLIRCLLENGPKRNHRSNCSASEVVSRSALHHACQAANADVLELLISHGAADVDTRDHNFDTPLHLAVKCRVDVCEDQIRIMRLLVKSGADLEKRNKGGYSALHIATMYGCYAKVEMLLSHGASTDNRQNEAGSGLLHSASYRDRYPLAKLLIENGATINCLNSNGITPLLANISSHGKSDIAALLVYHGATMQEGSISRGSSSNTDDISGSRGYPRGSSGSDNNISGSRSTSSSNSMGYPRGSSSNSMDCPRGSSSSSSSSRSSRRGSGSSNNMSLMASCIHGMRLDCETLAVLLFAAGYDLNQDPWLVPKSERKAFFGSESDVVDTEVVIPGGRMKNLCDWLRRRQSEPRSLTTLCRVRIREQLSIHTAGKSIVNNVHKLGLPKAVCDFVKLEDVIKFEKDGLKFVNGTDGFLYKSMYA